MSRPGADRGWWERNWGWVLGCGCLSVIALPAGCLAVIYFGSLGWIKSTGFFDEALERVRADPRVVRELGEPIETTWSGLDGSVNLGDDAGADMRMGIKGPRGSGSLHLVAERRGDAWALVVLEVEIEGRDGPIDVLAGAAEEPDELNL